MAFNTPLIKRAFIQQQSAFRTVNNTTGVWSATGAKLVRIPRNGLTITPNQPKTAVDWLTGTASQQPGIEGRRSASWSFNNVQLIPSGAAGTVPDIDVLLQNIFGGPATASAGVSQTYGPFVDSGYLPMTILEFPHAQTAFESQLIWGSIVQQFSLNLNGNIFEGSFSGIGGYALTSPNFSNEDSVAKAGLTAWPIEPSSPTTNGNVIPGFNATCTVDGQTLEQKVKSLSITVGTGLALVDGMLSDAYPVGIKRGQRAISVAFEFQDDDSAALQDLKQKARGSAVVNATFLVGANLAAGNQIQINMKGIQLVPHSLADSNDDVTARFSASVAHASAVGNTDEFGMVWQ